MASYTVAAGRWVLRATLCAIGAEVRAIGSAGFRVNERASFEGLAIGRECCLDGECCDVGFGCSFLAGSTEQVGACSYSSNNDCGCDTIFGFENFAND